MTDGLQFVLFSTVNSVSSGSQLSVQSGAQAAFLLEYLPVVILFAIALVISLAFLVMAKIFAPSSPDAEKISTYECGFNAFDDSRMKFDVRFYLVAILFIILISKWHFCFRGRFPWIKSGYMTGLSS